MRYFTQIECVCQQELTHFSSGMAYNSTYDIEKGAHKMNPWYDSEVDLDDLIYADEESGPSER